MSVVSVHFSLGLALHIGQRTDNICLKVSLFVPESILFNMATSKE